MPLKEIRNGEVIRIYQDQNTLHEKAWGELIGVSPEAIAKITDKVDLRSNTRL